MVYLEKAFHKHKLDYGSLSDFHPIQGSEVEIVSEETYQINIEWVKNFALGVGIIPVFTNNESDCVGVFSSSPLKGKIVLMNHGEADFTPRFSSISSFITQINPIVGDWHNLPAEAFDYPIKDDFTIHQELLLDCWKLIDQNTFDSEEHRALICQTAAFLTLPSALDTLLPFLKDRNPQIVDKVAWLLGVFHQYTPAQPLIADLVKTRYKHHYLREHFYNGLFAKKRIWKKLFGK
ncbi:hypothetical protein [uncultured Microscilla sp.]|uniref:hypothetical protein n=1 Tax=uncultured Microscilla sp. TaxID=432653 RepID=UPI0026250E05|nr:hypothetical protein [uncultured Microscilla sp.]